MGNDCCAQARDNKGIKRDGSFSNSQKLLESPSQPIDIIDLNHQEQLNH